MLSDFQHRIYVHDLTSGLRLYSIPLGSGSVREISGKKARSEVLLSLESFTVPKIIYRIDFATANRTEAPALIEWRRTHVTGLDEDAFLVEQVFFESEDKTKVPMYIISLKDAPRNGESPTILYGYGGEPLSL
ncbi:hypothetical protein ANCCAN_16338 [Ancylostoma caninum]|uniref:Peptidase S9A N-terminal domain-containing protein n=1 Tax=Ancylostoma caninum TaxID=29170 RepID=A0A368G440_ANCCA|nr:hypothetical protein ANCCAN_16338 [Ancylostoma caninum]